MSGIQVAQGQERFIKPLANYTQDQCENKLEYVTGQNTNGQKRALDAVIYGLAATSTNNVIAAGSSKRVIKKTAHNARKNDVVQFTSGLSEGVSIQILSCPDADTMILAATSEFDIAIGDTFDIKRYVTPQYDEDGALVVVATPGPTQYVYNGSDTEVEEDTAAPENNRPLPSKMFIQKDGTTQAINKNTGVPSDTVAMPVEIVGLNGTPINIVAGDISIQTTSEGSTFDSMRIGSGVGLYAEITPNSELSVHDQDVLDELDSHGTYLANIMTEIGEVNTEITAINAKTPNLGQALEAASVPVVLPALQLAALATETTLATLSSSIGLPADTMATDYFGTFSHIALTKRLGLYLSSIDTQMVGKATETTLSAINAKTPALGQALEAASVPVVLPALQLSTLATAARQDLQTASLISIDSKLTSPLTTTQAVPTIAGTDESSASINNTSGYTFAKPAGAKNMVIFNNGADVLAFPGTNASRVRIGQAPDWSSGVGAILGVGGSTALLPATTFTAVAENNTANANVTVLWFY